MSPVWLFEKVEAANKLVPTALKLTGAAVWISFAVVAVYHALPYLTWALAYPFYWLLNTFKAFLMDSINSK